MPDRVDLLACRGPKALAWRRVPITLDQDPHEWAKAVRRAGATLAQAVKALELEDRPAVVVYRSPTQAVDLSSYQLRSASQAIDAATLSCTDSLPYSAMTAVCRAVVV